MPEDVSLLLFKKDLVSYVVLLLIIIKRNSKQIPVNHVTRLVSGAIRRMTTGE